MPIDLERMRVVARRAALVGGDAIRTGGRPAEGEAKGPPGDWVTEVDVASETAIRSFLHEETPDTPMLGEESGGVSEGLPPSGYPSRSWRIRFPSPARSTRPSSATCGMPRAARERC